MPLLTLKNLARLIRYYILVSTSAAGSGHPSSSLSATDLMATLMFSATGGGGPFFRANLEHPEYPNNDRLVFSKGHAAPLLYSLYAAAGKVSEKELLTLRQFGSRLEGHPTRAFPYAEAATGSLGQGLSIGVGLAINAKYLDKLSYRTWVLLGDSEMSEGAIWEAIQLAAYYKLDNLIGLIDVNRLGQRGETMYGHRLNEYARRIKAFGWKTIMVDGHNIKKIAAAYRQALRVKGRPVAIIAKTIKGQGVSFIANKENWHGRALSAEELARALQELGPVDKKWLGAVARPAPSVPRRIKSAPMVELDASYDKPISARQAYGHALVEAYPQYPNMVVLDAEVSNSTYAVLFKERHPDHFFEMFIAEQNMVGVALGLSARGKIPFVSTFASFFTRALDQIRLAEYSGLNINFVGSHVGVSIGQDGPSQMGLEDMAIFRAILGSCVLYAADHLAEETLVKNMIERPGINYMRTTRGNTTPLYKLGELFPIGGSKVLRESPEDTATVVAAGVTLYEALKAYEALLKDKIKIRVIDLYSIKPIDTATLAKAARETKAIITVEDHYAEGGLGEAVVTALAECQRLNVKCRILAVRKMPKSGQPEELLAYEEIDAAAIVSAVKKII